MSKTKNLFLAEGAIISALAISFKASFLVFLFCVALMFIITVIRTKLWVITLTTILTTFWGLIGFEIGVYLGSFNIEFILATICLALAAGFHMAFLNLDEYNSLIKKQGKSRDC